METVSIILVMAFTGLYPIYVLLVRDKHEPKVCNRSVSKHYGVVYDKRKLLPDFTTLPYGFKICSI